MNIVIFSVGSRGDVQPYIALGRGLQGAGHRVRLATHAAFEPFVRAHHLEFTPAEGNPRAIFESEGGLDWLESGANPLAFGRTFVRLIKPLAEQMLADLWGACQGADLIVCSALALIAGRTVAEAIGASVCIAPLQPMHHTCSFPNIIFPPKLPVKGIANWLTYLVAEQVLWQPFRGSVNRWRREVVGLPPYPFWGPFNHYFEEGLPFIYGFSPTILPRPPDWPDSAHVAGYWFLDQATDWQPPPELSAFLEAGPPPVYIGFGSMSCRNPATLTRTILHALAETRQRAILLNGWGGLGKTALPDNVFQIDAAPHDWLFPRMAAVVHHGGAGTTAAGLRAGVPTIVTPFFADQFHWGARVAALGLGPKPIPQQRLTVSRLAAAIQAALSDEGMRTRARAIGERLRRENGIARAVALIEACAGAA